MFAALAGVVAFSGRAHAATELGKFTVSPASGNITDIPMTTSVTTSAGCNLTTAQTVLLRLVSPANPSTLLPLAQSVAKSGVGADPFTVGLQAITGKSLQSQLASTGLTAPFDGTYTAALTCGTSTTADRFLAKVRVTGDTWTLLEQQATSLALTATGGVSVGSDLKLTAAVSPGAAAGSVEFKNGDTSLGTATVTDGKAELTVKAPAIGGLATYSAVFTPADPDAYATSEATVSALIGYAVSAKDADGRALGADPTLAIGQKVKVTVQGFTPAATVGVTLTGSNATYPDVTASADGAVVDYAFTVPDALPNGDHGLHFSEKSGVFASLDFVSTDAATSSPSPTENPDLTVTDEDGKTLGTNPSLDAGQKVTITARGYTASAAVKVTLADSDATFADAKANTDGTVDTYAFTVPSDIADGDHTLTLAEDKTDGHSVAFAFTTGTDDSTESPSPSASDTESSGTPTGGSGSDGSDTGGTTGGDSGTGSGSMAATGTEVGAIGLASLAFLAAGSALVLHMRRKGLLAFGNGDTPQHR
jgi:hypothetical protein